jgi:hypothetical protein
MLLKDPDILFVCMHEGGQMLKVVKKDLQFAFTNSNTKVVDMVSPAPPYAPPAKFK